MPLALDTPVHPRKRGIAALFDLRHRSLIRANLLMFLSFLGAVFLSDFPHNHANPLITIPTAIAFWATFETVRCMQRRWSFYHAGVILCIYMDLMAVATILFFLFYPYTHFPASSR